MTYVFTDFVRSLDPATGEPVDPEAFPRLWQALRGALRGEIRQRGLLDRSPSLLGIYGWNRWESTQPDREISAAAPLARARDALDELTADGYVYVFVTRLRSLRRQLRLKPNIDGLVFRSLRNFLHDTQKQQDPLGFRVFVVVRSAVELALRSGRLHVLRGGPRIRNDTLFGSDSSAGPSPAGGENLDRVVRSWNDELLPDLLTARGKAEEALVERLEILIGRLPADGITAFAFKDLIDPLRADARARWASLWQQAEGETAIEDPNLLTVVRLLQPDTRFEERERFLELARKVEEGLDDLRVQSRTRKHLLTLWQFLRAFAMAGVEDPAARHRFLPAAEEERIPSYRKLSQLLDIPRDRFPDLLATLREQIERCFQATSSVPAVSSACGAVSEERKSI